MSFIPISGKLPRKSTCPSNDALLVDENELCLIKDANMILIMSTIDYNNDYDYDSTSTNSTNSTTSNSINGLLACYKTKLSPTRPMSNVLNPQ